MLLLASASPARRRLLEQAAIPHRVRVSGVDEEAIKDPDPAQLVQRLAQAKAQAVHQLLADAAPGEEPITAVLGCDSVLAFEGEVFGKPLDAAEAVTRWRRMAGGWGELHTGHCLLAVGAARECPVPDIHGYPAAEQLATITTRVQFADLSLAEIEAYVASGEPQGKAGAYAIQGRAAMMVSSISGSYSGIMGLPLYETAQLLRSFGFKL
ncbi:MAG: septum formation protein Maf [Synechococcaceae bacterium WB4_1_0192]|nr:septum formation protein Maf [Synechococcaceae bacterium WB4_1_0192]